MRSAEKRRAAQLQRHEELLSFERELWGRGCVVGGLDEAGAGPLAGPVTAACVVLDPSRVDELVGVDDSKRVPAARRDKLYVQIRESALAFGIAHASPKEIDELNIRAAGILAMERALEKANRRLGSGKVDHALVDAREIAVEIEQTSLIKGDARSLSIAAASILAKVTRDRLMNRMDARYPGYGFGQNMGYPTPQHLAALERLEPCPIHRRTFEPIRSILVQQRLFP